MIELIRKPLLDTHIREIRRCFGIARLPVDEDALLKLYRAKDYASMVRFVRAAYQLSVPVTLGLVNKGGPSDAAAFLETEVRGRTPVKFTLYIHKSFLAEHEFEEVVIAISHEVSHIFLRIQSHPLNNHEEAVDLTAMLFGFRDFYVTSCETSKVIDNPLGGQIQRQCRVGYLSRAEAIYAAVALSC